MKSPWLCEDDVEVTDMIVLTFEGAAAFHPPPPPPSSMAEWLKMLIFSTLRCSSTHCCGFESIVFGDLPFCFVVSFAHITTAWAQVE